MRIELEGSYKLVYRELPDGTKQSQPDVVGLMTYTKEFRNFNVYWKDAEGKSFSISYVASYKLTDEEYSEKSIYHMETTRSMARSCVTTSQAWAAVRRCLSGTGVWSSASLSMMSHAWSLRATSSLHQSPVSLSTIGKRLTEPLRMSRRAA